MEQEQNARVNIAGLLTDRLKEIWGNFMEEFQQSFDLDQLDLVFSVLKELESSSQNPTTKKITQLMQEEEASTEDNHYHQLSLEKKVFSNHLLAKSVFKCLSNSDLLSCRLMNYYWNEYATEILLKRDLKINFMRKTYSNRFYHRGEPTKIVSNWRTLDMFTQLLRTSKQFPCSRFVFWGGNLGNDDAQRFFSFHGSSVKSIDISFYGENRGKSEAGFSVAATDSRVIGMILSQQLPNLENLKLDFYNNEDWPGFKSLLFPPCKQIMIPNLKIISYKSRKGNHDFLRQLLKAAVSLKWFEFGEDDYFNMNYLDLFIETGKIKSIYDVFFNPLNLLNELEKMVGHGPELKSLSLQVLYSVYKYPKLWGKISTILSKFLHSSQKSLQQLYLFKSLGFLRQLQLPVLENVTELDLEVLKVSAFYPQDVHDYTFSFLPRGATFAKNFPRLSSVEISVSFNISSAGAAPLWKKCFPTNEIVPTVKKLNFFGLCPVLWMEKFSEMFPNLETLSVSKIKDFPNFSKILWKSCRKLKSLDVGIDLSSALNAHPALDSSFTGLSPEVCKRLNTFSKSTLEYVAKNYMKNQPSLLDLTDLHTLQINFDFPGDSNYEYPTVLSPLAGICVFRPLESLREVKICYSIDTEKLNDSLIFQNLELLRPYKVEIYDSA